MLTALLLNKRYQKPNQVIIKYSIYVLYLDTVQYMSIKNDETDLYLSTWKKFKRQI